MNGLITNITTEMNNMIAELGKVRTGNKAAAARARKLTLSLEKQFKQFRKESVKM